MCTRGGAQRNQSGSAGDALGLADAMEELVSVRAQASVWRVYGLQVDPPDGPAGGWQTSTNAGRQTGDETTLWVGDVPPELLDSRSRRDKRRCRLVVRELAN